MPRAALIVLAATVGVSTLLAQRPQTTLGDPLPGLTADQLSAFEEGQEEFSDAEPIEEGVGPVCNEPSCAACQAGPNGAVGGSSDRLEIRFGYVGDDGVFDPMTY